MNILKVSEGAEFTGYAVQASNAKATILVYADEVRVDWLWVEATARQSGVGRALLLKLRAFFGKPVRPITVISSAIPFWQKMQAEHIVGAPDFVYA